MTGIITQEAFLEAVNEMLAAVGEAPVNTLENPMNTDVISCIRILNKVNRSEQSRDWSFNQVPQITLNPDVFTNKIPWSDTYLHLKGNTGAIYQNRNGFVYDIQGQTDIFDSSITVEALLLLSFEEMPEVFRDYITAKAALEFQKRFLGDVGLTQALQEELQEKWMRLQEYDIELTKPNMLRHPQVQTLLNRG